MFLLGQRIGNYEIQKSIGRGTFGAVYLVRDMFLEQPRAIKVPHDQSPAGREAILRESRLLATLEHPNIVRLIACDEHEETLFLVMEWVKGTSLARRLDGEAPLSAAASTRIARQVLRGLAHAHDRKLLHGDISADNILLSGEVAKITDFGMARTVHVAEHGARWIGNPYYLAPEQFHAEAVFASDVYGVGVVLYQMLTGSLPYQDSDPERQRALVEAGGNEHPRRQVPSVSTDLDAVVAKALAPRVSNRYPNAESMLSDLRELASFGPPPEERRVVMDRIREAERPSRTCWNCGRRRHPDATHCAHCGA
ncbi:MAG: protein kinase [Acidobacteriota bacterium]|nr:protein kinase [Acidobacteriota bacterium]